MCKVDVYYNADGTLRARETTHCRLSRRNLECDKAEYRRHDPPAPIPIPSPRVRYPPSPRLTPGSSPHMGTSPRTGFSPRATTSPYMGPAAPPTPQPGSDSDTSARQRRRRSGSFYVNINGQRVVRVEAPRRPERPIIVENPPTTRPPPRNHAIPRTAPPSPSPAVNEALRHRPVIVDDKERKEKRVRLDVPDSEGSSSGSRRRERRVSARELEQERERLEWEREKLEWERLEREREAERERREADAERRERRRERAAAVEAEDARQRAREARIEAANRRIAERAPRPVPSRRGTGYVRPTVEVPQAGLGVWEAERGMRGLAVEDEEEGEDEEEARRQRLRERMMPRRRATIGAGSRRVRVVYGDGMYSLE